MRAKARSVKQNADNHDEELGGGGGGEKKKREKNQKKTNANSVMTDTMSQQ